MLILGNYLGRKLLFKEFSDFQVFSFTSLRNFLPKSIERNICQWCFQRFMERHIFGRYLLKLLNFNLTDSDFIQGSNSMETNSGLL